MLSTSYNLMIFIYKFLLSTGKNCLISTYFSTRTLFLFRTCACWNTNGIENFFHILVCCYHGIRFYCSHWSQHNHPHVNIPFRSVDMHLEWYRHFVFKCVRFPFSFIWQRKLWILFVCNWHSSVLFDVACLSVRSSPHLIWEYPSTL